MQTASHQTIRLSAGKHAGPDEGACVMELASMLAGEPFGDHPQSCCPVVSAFLRTYNDLVDDERRQDLYRFAALVVHSRSDPDVEKLRAAMCVEWGCSRHLEWHRRGLRRLWPLSWRVRPTLEAPAAAGVMAARVAARRLIDSPDEHHREALAFAELLISAGRRTGTRTHAGRQPEPDGAFAVRG